MALDDKHEPPRLTSGVFYQSPIVLQGNVRVVNGTISIEVPVESLFTRRRTPSSR